MTVVACDVCGFIATVTERRLLIARLSDVYLAYIIRLDRNAHLHAIHSSERIIAIAVMKARPLKQIPPQPVFKRHYASVLCKTRYNNFL